MRHERLSVPAILAFAALGAAVAGCSRSAAPPETTTATVFETVTEPAPESGAELDSNATPSEATEMGSEEQGPPVITPQPTGQVLTLSDIFSASGWTEQLIEVPKQTDSVTAITAPLTCGSSAATLELRFQNSEGILEATIAQALDSPGSDATVEVRMYADGRLADVKKINFDQSATLSTELTGVSALRIEASATAMEEYSSCRTEAAITQLKITRG